MSRAFSVRILLLIIGTAMSPGAFSQPTTDNGSSNITNAQWADYKKQYPVSPLCASDEITLWTCEGRKKIYSLCSSREVTATTGYIQYRAGNRQKVPFQFPAQKRQPKGTFEYESSITGDAMVTFKNGDFTYDLYDPLRDASYIVVSRGTGNEKGTQISCDNPNQSLQLNYTIKMMREAGIDQSP